MASGFLLYPPFSRTLYDQRQETALRVQRDGCRGGRSEGGIFRQLRTGGEMGEIGLVPRWIFRISFDKEEAFHICKISLWGRDSGSFNPLQIRRGR